MSHKVKELDNCAGKRVQLLAFAKRQRAVAKRINQLDNFLVTYSFATGYNQKQLSDAFLQKMNI